MTQQTKTVIEDAAQYRFLEQDGGRALLFEWKPAAQLSIEDFRRGIALFASLCARRKPAYAVIDAAGIGQGSPALASSMFRQSWFDPRSSRGHTLAVKTCSSV